MNMGHHFLENFGVLFSFFPFPGIARKGHRQEIQANKLFFFSGMRTNAGSGNIGPQDAVTLSLVAVFPHVNQF